MKVALVTPLPDPQRWSMKLYERKLWESLKHLLARGEEVDLVPSLRDYAEWICDLSTVSGKLKRYYQQYIQFGRVLQKMDADIFHITDHAYGNLIPFLRGRKVVVTFHDALLPNLAGQKIPVSHQPQTSILAQRYCLSQLPKAARIISVSNFSKQECLKYSKCKEQNIVPIHSGVAEHFLRPVGETEKAAFRNQWNLNGKIIVIAGRNDLHKNLEGSILTLEKLFSEHKTDFTVLKIGSDFSAAQKKLLHQTGLISKTRFLGSVKDDQLPLIYQISDALLFLSFYEGFGFPTIEAMASGTVAVVSNRGSLPEIAGDAAVITDPENPSKAAADLYSVLTDIKLRQQFIDKGRRRAETFQWSKTASSVLKLYREIYREPYAA